jgi:hypothetical protein
MWGTIYSIRATLRFHDYKPQPLNCMLVREWTKQFKKDWRLAERLLDNVVYISESRTRDILVNQNTTLMKRLAAAGLPPKKLIYVQVHDAGSSSPVMLNLLRDAANLERLGSFEEADKERLELMCRGVNPRSALGYRGLATMVVLYRNAPNTVPPILRGSRNQAPFFGIFPPTTDLPLRRVREENSSGSSDRSLDQQRGYLSHCTLEVP